MDNLEKIVPYLEIIKQTNRRLIQMFQQLKSKVLIFILIVICFNSCYANNKDVIHLLLNNEYPFLRGGSELQNTNFLVMGKEEYFGESIIIFFDKNFKIKNYLKYENTSSYQPIFETKKYIVFGFIRNTDKGGRNIVVYDIQHNNFHFIEVEYHLIWNFYIHKNDLFYSSEMANPHLNVVNLQTGKQYHCDIYDCPVAEFGTVNDEVYATNDKQNFYVYREGEFIKTDNQISNFQSEFHEVADYKIDRSVLKKLH